MVRDARRPALVRCPDALLTMRERGHALCEANKVLIPAQRLCRCRWRSPAQRSEDGRLEGWRRALCSILRDASEHKFVETAIAVSL